jgi:hypothetical protein
MSSLVNIGPYSLTIARLLVIAGTAQLFLFGLMSIASRSPLPKRGMRTSERNLVLSTVLFAALWLVAFDARSLLRSLPRTPRAEAAVMGRSSSGSCATLARDMTAAQVQKRLGEPDERKSDEETRGPGSTIWIYRDSRCAVHLFDNKVEFIE